MSQPGNERMFELEWARRARPGSVGALEFAPGWVAEQSRSVWVIDVRGRDELVGPLGHVPGATWVAFEKLPEAYEKLGPSVPVVLVSRTGRRASPSTPARTSGTSARRTCRPSRPSCSPTGPGWSSTSRATRTTG